MAEIEYTPEALADIERAFEFLADHDAYAASTAVSVIRGAVDLLRVHPMIGRVAEGQLRELVISHGRTGYVALYRFRPERNEVRILSIRHQRELDYPR